MNHPKQILPKVPTDGFYRLRNKETIAVKNGIGILAEVNNNGYYQLYFDENLYCVRKVFIPNVEDTDGNNLSGYDIMERYTGLDSYRNQGKGVKGVQLENI